MVPDRDVERHAGRDTRRRTARCQERAGDATLFGPNCGWDEFAALK
jgi:hypothetical protein